MHPKDLIVGRTYKPNGYTLVEYTAVENPYGGHPILRISKASVAEAIGRLIPYTEGRSNNVWTEMFEVEQPIIVGGHTVKFEKGHIKIGCTTIDHTTCRKIWERIVIV